MKTTLLGIIGCGHICTQYFKALANLPGVRVDACADLDLARAQARAAEYGVRALTVDELLADPAVEIIINLTIPAAHAPVNRAILNAGKHAYTEKPFADNFAAGREVLELAQRLGLRVGGAPDTFLGGGIQTARHAIDRGDIGRPFAAVAHLAGHGPESWHPDPAFYYAPGGGPMLDMGPYYLTALVNLLGPIRRVSGSVGASLPERVVGSGPKQGQLIPVQVPTHYCAVLDFASGAIGTLLTSFDVWGHHLPRIEIYGTEGSLTVPDPNRFDGQPTLLRPRETEWTPLPLTHSDQVGRGIGVADLAESIQQNRPARASGDLALHILEAMEAIEKASTTSTYLTLTTTCERPEAL